MQVLRNVLAPELNESLRLYWNGLLKNAPHLLQPDPLWGGRRFRHDDPLFTMVHERLTSLVSFLVQKSIKKSYVFTTTYDLGASVPKHTDRDQCKYTLDYCLESSGVAWPLYGVNTEVHLNQNDAVFYYGCEELHWREPLKRDDIITMSFFHFVDSTFTGSLT